MQPEPEAPAEKCWVSLPTESRPSGLYGGWGLILGPPRLKPSSIAIEAGGGRGSAFYTVNQAKPVGDDDHDLRRPSRSSSGTGRCAGGGAIVTAEALEQRAA